MAATMYVIDENAVANFQENLAAKRAEFDEWAQSQIACAREMLDDHNDTMTKLQAETKSLQEDEKKYRVKAESLHTVLESERKEIEKIVEQLDELRSEESCLPPVVDSLRTEVSKDKAQFQSIQKKAHRQKALRDYKMKELAQGLDCYRSRLGLDFRGLQENELQFTFTKIDPQHQEREFSFVIFIKGENDYDLTKCSPDFPGSRNCLKHLNQTGDLTKFICMMRLGFRQMVTKP